jgi:indolepyruvate ferredoxin oxidoreductase beta subunit
MKCDIVLAGVGGQGILTIAAILGQVAVEQKIHVKQSEIHGMSQRGGSVFAHLRLSDQPIMADQITIGSADIVLAMEPMEALRNRSYLAEGGVLITNTTPIVNIPDYPEVQGILDELKALPKAVLLDADTMAREAGNARSSNIVLLGAVANHIDFPAGALEAALTQRFARKGDEVVAQNLKAFAAGKEAR